MIRNVFIDATVSGACNTLTTVGDYKVAKFINPGTFCVSASGPGSNTVDYFVVGGGGASRGPVGAANAGGGGGGFRVSSSLNIPAPTMSPLTTPVARVDDILKNLFSNTFSDLGF